ncbi:MAG: DUF2029 domain-containing protein [Cryobacterium sp.]|nr:DUF2029 domain-containing protein [Oligoflexia bacterium]
MKRYRGPLILLILVTLGLSAVLMGRTLSRGDDFLVFYRVAQRFWDGVRPYDSVTYGNMVFKYPPWILPLFLPFGFMDPLTAKLIWGFVEAGSLFAIVIRIHRGIGRLPAVRPAIQAFFLLTFFALFGSHGMTGQITLLVLALALWIDPVRSSFAKFFILAFAFSAKLTTLLPLLHSVKRKKIILNVLGVGALFIALSLPIYFHSYRGHYRALRTEWSAALFSGTSDVDRVRIGFTTREVQGLPSFLLRETGLDEKKPRDVLFAISVSTAFIVGFWIFLSRRLKPEVQWIGWLAVLPAVQPLAWFHVFLFTYPMLVFGAEEAMKNLRWRRVIGYGFCALLIGAVTAKTMGAAGSRLEFLSVKLWGSLAAICIFRKDLQS